MLSSCSEISILFKRAYSGSKVSSKKALNPLSCSLELVLKLYLKLNTAPVLCGNHFEIKQKFEKLLLAASESVKHMIDSSPPKKKN